MSRAKEKSVSKRTTRQDSAQTAATHFSFSDAEKLARDPAVDLVTVGVKVPDHYLPVMAAIEGREARLLRMAARP